MTEYIDTDVVTRLFLVKKNQIKLIKKRGYNIKKPNDTNNEETLLSITLKQFSDVYIPFAEKNNKSLRSVLTNWYEKDNGHRILVYYADVPLKSVQLGVEVIGDAITEMLKYKLKDAIIITSKPLSSKAYKHIVSLISYNIQVFLEEELTYSAVDHVFTPEHIPLTQDEQETFLRKNNIILDQMPKIFNTDIIIMYLGLQKGQIVKINRYNIFETSVIESTTYRVVIDE